MNESMNEKGPACVLCCVPAQPWTLAAGTPPCVGPLSSARVETCLSFSPVHHGHSPCVVKETRENAKAVFRKKKFMFTIWTA